MAPAAAPSTKEALLYHTILMNMKNPLDVSHMPWTLQIRTDCSRLTGTSLLQNRAMVVPRLLKLVTVKSGRSFKNIRPKTIPLPPHRMTQLQRNRNQPTKRRRLHQSETVPLARESKLRFQPNANMSRRRNPSHRRHLSRRSRIWRKILSLMRSST
jgi:hypothetical protein